MKYIYSLCLSIFGLLPSVDAQVFASYPIEMEKVENLNGLYDWEEDYEANIISNYNPSAKRLNDILNIDLSLQFDFDNRLIHGKETLWVKPYNLPVDSLVLDAKGMKIESVAILQGTQVISTTYSYDNYFLKIALDKSYTRDQKYSIVIKYIAQPYDLAKNAPDIKANERGAYFISPSTFYPNKPVQIWTQGEPEANSTWFALIDKPNERFTHTIRLTVPDSLKTLSNGVLTSGKAVNNLRTDVWTMSQENAAYLVAFVVGDFAVIKDTWNGKDLSYWVEPAYEKSAKLIFNRTKEMLSFFSDKLGVPYPYQSYNQIVVRDYVSGAMENTGCVIFGEFVQRHAKDLKFHENDGIVAHELFHHWFGNLVTCESWANLPLNESFANYSEYLWFEHAYGRFYADEKAQEEKSSYFEETLFKTEDLIRFNYSSIQDMFDSHSYAKGGRVLHMLRYYLGDETFYRGLQLYLKSNANKNVEIHQLRLAFEEISGEDLNWFFNQWFLDNGHPDLNVDLVYSDDLKSVEVRVLQYRTHKNGYYELPLEVDFYLNNGTKVRKSIRVEGQESSFSFSFPQQILNTNFDAEKVLLANLLENKETSEWLHQWRNAPLYLDKFYALQNLLYLDEPKLDVYSEALQMKSNGIQLEAIKAMGEILSPEDFSKLVPLLETMLADTNLHHDVRIACLGQLSQTWLNNEWISNLNKLVIDPSEELAIYALQLMFVKDYNIGVDAANKMETSNNSAISKGLSEIYWKNKVPNKMPFYKTHASHLIEIFDEYLYLIYMDAYVQEMGTMEDKIFMAQFLEHNLKAKSFDMILSLSGTLLSNWVAEFENQGKLEEAERFKKVLENYYPAAFIDVD